MVLAFGVLPPCFAQAGSESVVQGPSSAAPTVETRTRHATFKQVGFDELPGWNQDDLLAGWPAFRSSCAALQRREAWRELCAQSAGVARTSAAIRAFFEARFSLLRILNTDASAEGEITGYFEPLLQGRRQPDSIFSVPVLGVPRDLYTLDWMAVPPADRRAVVHVRPEGSSLAVLRQPESGSAALDLRRFVLDSKDRRLRVRLSPAGNGWRADPYPTRAELTSLGLPAGVDAPVLAWVDDALALYAMQVQGSGRIRLADGAVLRVQYAEQNGHPFRPLRVVAKAGDAVRTRSVGPATGEPDRFVLEDDAASAPESAAPAVAGTPSADAATDDVVTRGIGGRRAAAGKAAPNPDAAVESLVDQLLAGGSRRAGSDPPAGSAAGPVPTHASVAPGRPTGRPPVASNSAPLPRPTLTPPVPAAQAPRIGPTAGPAAPSTGLAAAPALAQTPAPGALASDPSYVFFKVAADQASSAGPPGALGVPLTPGRSVAVDPRVTPLGYPVYLAAPAPKGSTVDMRRLMFAQDTGGAIRGAVRADFFWGFGADAGRLARGTRHRGEMWLLMPQAEAARLGQGGVLTRSLGSPASGAGECLIADEEFCREPE